LSEIAPNFASFWFLQFWGKAPKILDWHYKFGLVLITVQNFMPLG